MALNPRLNSNARLPRTAHADAEAMLWNALKQGQLDDANFRRRQEIWPYVVDFVCHEYGLIVEIDGPQHARAALRDTARAARLKALGYRVVRFWNSEVTDDLPGVIEQIRRAL